MDLFNRVAYKGNVNISNMDAASQKAFAAHATKLANDYKIIAENEKKIDELNNRIINLRKVAGKKMTQEQKNLMNMMLTDVHTSERSILEARKKVGKLHDLITNKYHLSNEQMANLAEVAKNNSSAILEGNKKYSTSLYGLNNTIKNGAEGMVHIAKDFFAEFGFMGQAIGLALEQMVELNKKLVEFNRSMSLGFSNNLLGMDLYGNSSIGSLATISGSNNLSEDQYLAAFSGLAKGNALNGANVGGTRDITKFGIETAQISKFYGVSMETLTQTSTNLIYTYGMKIKEVSKVFDDGKRAAIGAGVSVKNYFQNLREATDLVGQEYVSGGVQGLSNLALYASKTDQSISSIMKTASAFKDYTTSFEKQNTAAAFAMQNTAQQTSKIWSLEFMGRKQEADQLFKGSVVKDVIANGMIDKNNVLNGRGMRTLEGMGMDQEQIKSIQKLITMQKQYGITIDQLNNKEKQSLDIQAKIQQFEYKNLTISEKFQSMWAKLKGAIIDPLASIISPIFDIVMNVLGTTVDVLTPILKVFGYPLLMLGKLLTKVSEAIGSVLSKISAFANKFTVSMDDSVSGLGRFSKTILAAIGGFMLFKKDGLLSMGRAAVAGTSKIFSTGGRIGSIIASGKGSLLNPGSMAGNAGRGIVRSGAGALGKIKNLSSGLKGFGIGAIATIGGDMLGNAVGGKGGDAISNIASAAGTGAMIGSVIPVVGTAVGALIGGVAGLVYSSKDKIASVWADSSKNVFEKIWGTYAALWETIYDGFKGIWDWAKGLFSDDDKEKFEANKAASEAANPYAAMKALDDVQRVVDYRTKEDTSFQKEANQAAAMQQVFAPNITIKQSFDGTIKTRIQNR